MVNPFSSQAPDAALTNALLQYSDWYVMRDVLIPADDRTMHIDFVIASPQCIFLGEYKTYQGIIAGSGMNKYWKQYVGGAEIDYFSPVMQNLYHMLQMRKFLSPVPYELHFHSLVVMQPVGRGGRLELTGPYPADTSIVQNLNAMRRIVQLVCEKRKMHLTEAETQYIYDYIGEHQLRGEDMRRKHAAESADYKLNARRALAQQICPECLSPLKPVGTPTGNYWVCSRYPDCKYTHKM